eukprot:11161349-Lingulodinium_polyedra.AAC.1
MRATHRGVASEVSSVDASDTTMFAAVCVVAATPEERVADRRTPPRGGSQRVKLRGWLLLSRITIPSPISRVGSR